MNEIKFKNLFGYFNETGKEYFIDFTKSNPTPRPWSNVIANPGFGTIVSESSLGTTWIQNSKDKRITSWSNDWVTDSPSEVIYIKDLEKNIFWSATPNPYCDQFKVENTEFHVRHGQGYSSFEHEVSQIHTKLKTFVDINDPVKILDLKIRNNSKTKRKLSFYYYLDIVMGGYKNQFDNYVNFEENIEKNVLSFFRTDRPDFKQKIFVTSSEKIQSWTSNKNLFVGYLGSMAHPEGLKLDKLHNQINIPRDNCLALQIQIELEPLERSRVFFLLGSVDDSTNIDDLLTKYIKRESIEKSLFGVKEFWNSQNSAITINTPDESLNILFNNWTLYQVLSCRMWARSSFYQSSGAYGFRDQLQDSLAFLNSNPDITRDHIKKAASRQYTEGDVQHWWFEETGLGVRNKVADSALWLPYVTALYIEKTDDWHILNENLPFLEGRPLTAEEPAYVEVTLPTDNSATLLEHCLRAIRHVSDFGTHGLPLMKEGDWNDGMNLVGKKGYGESIWLGWFLSFILQQFISIANKLNNQDLEKELKANLELLKLSLHNSSWDGNWYLRALSDDGQKLGSETSIDCKIDSISQSWSVISNIDDAKRQLRAIDSVLKNLVDWTNELVFLINPPFDKAPLNPGYIKDYPPGIRENGGQYSHAVFWLITGLIKQKKFEEAYRILNFTNPIYRTRNDEKIFLYKTEPYAIVGDIYSAPEHMGKGGWSWYTGSAALFYTTVLEQILGFKKKGNTLKIYPGVPKDWTKFEIKYLFGGSTYTIKASFESNHNNIVKKVLVDDVDIQDFIINLVDDGKEHEVKIFII